MSFQSWITTFVHFCRRIVHLAYYVPFYCTMLDRMDYMPYCLISFSVHFISRLDNNCTLWRLNNYSISTVHSLKGDLVAIYCSKFITSSLIRVGNFDPVVAQKILIYVDQEKQVIKIIESLNSVVSAMDRNFDENKHITPPINGTLPTL